MSDDVCISINNLSKKYKNSKEESLKGVSFSVTRGEKFGVLGPNGAGKTTLISVLCGILPATKGNFSYYKNGKPLSNHEIKSGIGYVPQDFAFYDELTPMQNLHYFGAIHNLNKKTIEERAEEIFTILGISKVSDKKTKIFSGGLKRRINLAIGIIHKPSVLFLDEPTVGADVQSKHAMIEYLKKLNNEGTTIIYTSHHMAEAEEFCDRIAFINNGSIIECDNLNNLMKKHDITDLQSLFISLTGEGYFD